MIMKTSIHNIVKVALVASFVTLLSSCASTSDIDSIKAMAEQAQQTAQEMSARLKQAEDNASNALATAKDADQKADQALQAANDAQACCKANTERMDKMFKKLQQK